MTDCPKLPIAIPGGLRYDLDQSNELTNATCGNGVPDDSDRETGNLTTEREVRAARMNETKSLYPGASGRYYTALTHELLDSGFFVT